jgi:hypothetical protein
MSLLSLLYQFAMGTVLMRLTGGGVIYCYCHCYSSNSACFRSPLRASLLLVLNLSVSGVSRGMTNLCAEVFRALSLVYGCEMGPDLKHRLLKMASADAWMSLCCRCCCWPQVSWHRLSSRCAPAAAELSGLCLLSANLNRAQPVPPVQFAAQLEHSSACSRCCSSAVTAVALLCLALDTAACQAQCAPDLAHLNAGSCHFVFVPAAAAAAAGVCA